MFHLLLLYREYHIKHSAYPRHGRLLLWLKLQPLLVSRVVVVDVGGERRENHNY